MKDKIATRLECNIILRELRTTMFLVGAESVEKLSGVEVNYGLAK